MFFVYAGGVASFWFLNISFFFNFFFCQISMLTNCLRSRELWRPRVLNVLQCRLDLAFDGFDNFFYKKKKQMGSPGVYVEKVDKKDQNKKKAQTSLIPRLGIGFGILSLAVVLGSFVTIKLYSRFSK